MYFVFIVGFGFGLVASHINLEHERQQAKASKK
jgi:hypothetical protein